MNFAKAHFISIFSECVIATPPPPSPLSYIQCKETKTFKSISELGYMFVLKYSILAAEDTKKDQVDKVYKVSEGEFEIYQLSVVSWPYDFRTASFLFSSHGFSF